MSLFEADTAVQPTGNGCFAASVTDRWDGLAGRPLGGYVLAIALRALREVMPVPDLLVASAFFLNPVGPGPVQLRTELTRVGGRTATGQVRLHQNDAEALRAMATFSTSSLSGGQNLMLGSNPDLPPPDKAIEMHEGGVRPTAPIADRVEYRLGAREEPPTPGSRPATSLVWMRLTEGGGDDLFAIPFLVDAAPPAVMKLGATTSTTIELSLHVRAKPNSEWFASRATTSYVIDGYHDEDFELWDASGRLVAQSRQLARLPKSEPIAIGDVGDRLTPS
jgi:acyl-CoA thioesterase